MAYRQQPFNFQNQQTAGSGAFGAGYKAKRDQLPCAAKILHSVHISSNDVGWGLTKQWSFVFK